MTARTSKTDPIRVDWLPDELTAPGRLGLTIAPGKCRTPRGKLDIHWDRNLFVDMRDLKNARVDVLACLLEDQELADLRIPRLFEAAIALSIRVERLPLRDADVPKDVHQLSRLIRRLHEHLDAGRSVAIHCAGGLGRSGLVAGCFLVAGGTRADEALRMLRNTRGPRCPDTPKQRRFVHGFECISRASWPHR